MEDKEAFAHLLKVLEKYNLTPEEVEAVTKALGILSWTTLRKGSLKSIKDKQFTKRTAQ